MAKVRKTKYIYKDGTYFEVGGDGVDQAARYAAATALATADSKAAIDDTAPSATSVYSSQKVEQEITAAVADFVSFAEDQTSRTDAEKAQARDNIGADASNWTSYTYEYTFNSQASSVTVFRKGYLRVFNANSNIKPAAANTTYTLFYLNAIDYPASETVRFPYTTKVNSAMKGYGMFTLGTDGEVYLVSSFSGNQEGRTTGAYVAAEFA